LTFFFDNTFPPQIAQILKIMEVDAVHLQDLFDPGVDDVDWIPRAGDEGWIVVTGDLGIHKKPAERLKLEEAKVVTVFLHRGFTKQKIWDQLAFITRHWPEIERSSSKMKRGSSVLVGVNGKIEII
jgi:hypothetical protein